MYETLIKSENVPEMEGIEGIWKERCNKLKYSFENRQHVCITILTKYKWQSKDKMVLNLK